jgi:hypothetical protein
MAAGKRPARKARPAGLAASQREGLGKHQPSRRVAVIGVGRSVVTDDFEFFDQQAVASNLGRLGEAQADRIAYKQVAGLLPVPLTPT